MEDNQCNENTSNNLPDKNLKFYYNKNSSIETINKGKIFKGKTFGESGQSAIKTIKINNQNTGSHLKNSDKEIATIDSQGRKQGRRTRRSYMKCRSARSKALKRCKTFHVNINGETDTEKIINKIANGSNITNLQININFNQNAPQKNYYVLGQKIIEDKNEKDSPIIVTK